MTIHSPFSLKTSVVLRVERDWHLPPSRLALDCHFKEAHTEQERLAYLDPCCRLLKSRLPYAPGLQAKKAKQNKIKQNQKTGPKANRIARVTAQ